MSAQGNHRFLFICGLHRSGTSLIHEIIRSHPAVSGFRNTGMPEDEGQYLQDVYPIAMAYGGPGKFCFEPAAHLTETSLLANSVSKERLTSQWMAHWDASKPVLVEKSPINLIQSRFLQKIFPNSYFLFVVRHPLPVSFATIEWSETDIPELVEHWEWGMSIALEDAKSLKHAAWMRYEDLLTNPSVCIRNIFDFIDVQKGEMHAPIDNTINYKYFSMWQSLEDRFPEKASRAKDYFDLAYEFGYYPENPYVRDSRITLIS